MRLPTALALSLGLLFVVAAFWVASEDHYNACVKAAEARYEPLVRPGGSSRTAPDAFGPGSVSHGRPVDLNEAARQAAVDGCSHLPF